MFRPSAPASVRRKRASLRSIRPSTSTRSAAMANAAGRSRRGIVLAAASSTADAPSDVTSAFIRAIARPTRSPERWRKRRIDQMMLWARAASSAETCPLASMAAMSSAMNASSESSGRRARRTRPAGDGGAFDRGMGPSWLGSQTLPQLKSKGHAGPVARDSEHDRCCCGFGRLRRRKIPSAESNPGLWGSLPPQPNSSKRSSAFAPWELRRDGLVVFVRRDTLMLYR